MRLFLLIAVGVGMWVGLQFLWYVYLACRESFARSDALLQPFIRFHEQEARVLAVQKQFPPDLAPAPLEYEFATDHVQSALLRAGRSSEKHLYDSAKGEIWKAWKSGRLPASWAVNTVRAYREAFAAAAEAEAAQLQEETVRFRQKGSQRPPAQWEAEVVRPRQSHRPQLPN